MYWNYVMSNGRLRVVQNCHNFPEYIEYAGGGGQWSPYAFLNDDYDALHFHTGSLKINIFKVVFWEGWRGSQKEYSVYALIMLTIMDDPIVNGWVYLTSTLNHMHMGNYTDKCGSDSLMSTNGWCGGKLPNRSHWYSGTESATQQAAENDGARRFIAKYCQMQLREGSVYLWWPECTLVYEIKRFWCHETDKPALVLTVGTLCYWTLISVYTVTHVHCWTLYVGVMSSIQAEYVLYLKLKELWLYEKCVMITTLLALSIAIRFLTRPVYVCVCPCLYMYASICLCVCVCLCMLVSDCIYLCPCIHVYACLSACAWTYLSMSACLYCIQITILFRDQLHQTQHVAARVAMWFIEANDSCKS